MIQEIIVAAVILLSVVYVIRKLIKTFKGGGSSPCCGCSGCCKCSSLQNIKNKQSENDLKCTNKGCCDKKD